MKVLKLFLWVVLGLGLAFLRNYFYIFQLVLPVYGLVFFYGLLTSWLIKQKQKFKILAISLVIGLIVFEIPGIDVFNRYSLEQLVIFGAGFLIGSLALRAYFKVGLSILFCGLIYAYATATLILNNYFIYNKVVPNYAFEFIGDGYHFFPEDNGKVKLVELWFINCAPCQEQLKFMEDFKTNFTNDPNVEYVTFNISAHDSNKKIIDVLNVLNVNPVVGRDTTNYFERLTNLSGYPQLLLIDRNNNLRFVYHGFPKESEWLFAYWIKDKISALAVEPLNNSR